LSTAPASLGFSMRGAFDSWKDVAATCDSSTSSASCRFAATPTGSSNSSTRVSAASLLQDFHLPDLTQLATGSTSRQSSGSPTLRTLESSQDAPWVESWMKLPKSCQEKPEFDKALVSKPIKLVDHIGGTNVDDGESTDDGESSDDDQGLCPAYSANAPIPSVGSVAHSVGKCKRCCFFPKGRCSNGYDCQFCHFAHEKRKNTKSKKKKGRRRKQRQNAMEAQGQRQSVMEAQGLGSCSRNMLSQIPQPASSTQQFLGGYTQAAQKSSKLVVHDLQFVPSQVTVNDLNFFPSAVVPGHQNSGPMLNLWHRC